MSRIAGEMALRLVRMTVRSEARNSALHPSIRKLSLVAVSSWVTSGICKRRLLVCRMGSTYLVLLMNSLLFGR